MGCRFLVTFQSAIPKFVVNISNYVSTFGIMGMEFAKPTSQVTKVPNYTELMTKVLAEHKLIIFQCFTNIANEWTFPLITNILI